MTISSSRYPSSTHKPPTPAATTTTNPVTTRKIENSASRTLKIQHRTSSLHLSTSSAVFTTTIVNSTSPVIQPTIISTPSPRATASNTVHVGSVANSTDAPLVSSPIGPTHPTISISSKTDSVGLVTGVTVTAVLVVTATLTIVLVSLILWLRKKTKRLDRKESQPPKVSLEERETDEDKRFSLSNPTYQPTAFQAMAEVERAQTPEHNFTNPLYTPVEGNNSEAVSAPTRPVDDYEYVETGFIKV